MSNGIFPPQRTTNIGKVRVLVGDLVERVDPEFPTAEAEYLFADVDIQAYLDLNGDNPKYAAADALDTMATNEAMILKKIRTEKLQTDGPAVANAIRLHAASLRARARQEDEALDAAESVEIVDFADPVSTWDVFEYRNGVLGTWL